MSDDAANEVQPLTDGQAVALRQAVNAVLDRRNFANQAGFQYNGKRDVWTVAGYPNSNELEGKEGFQLFLGYYERNELAGRIVDLVAKDTWSKAPVIVEKDVEESALNEAYGTMSDRLSLQAKYLRADTLARIGHYAVLFIGFRGTATDKDLAEPAPKATKPEDILFVTAFSEWSASIKTVVTDTNDPRFGLPLTYDIDLSGDLNSARNSGSSQVVQGAMTEVHYTRVIHVAEGLLQDDVYGRPALKRAINRLVDMQKVAASTGEAFWQVVDRILAAKLDPNAVIDGPGMTALGEKLEEIMHDLRRQFIGQGVEMEWLGGEAPDPTGAANLYYTLLAVAGDYPKRILIGSETGERASSEDLKAYFGNVAARRENYAEPFYVRAFIEKVGKALPAPESTENGYDIVWPPLFTEPAKEIAEANRTTAEAAKALTPIGGDPSALVQVDTEGTVTLVELDPDETATEDVGADALPPEPIERSDEDEEVGEEGGEGGSDGDAINIGGLRRFTRGA